MRTSIFSPKIRPSSLCCYIGFHHSLSVSSLYYYLGSASLCNSRFSFECAYHFEGCWLGTAFVHHLQCSNLAYHLRPKLSHLFAKVGRFDLAKMILELTETLDPECQIEQRILLWFNLSFFRWLNSNFLASLNFQIGEIWFCAKNIVIVISLNKG
jgi:hypothetical protein